MHLLYLKKYGKICTKQLLKKTRGACVIPPLFELGPSMRDLITHAPPLIPPDGGEEDMGHGGSCCHRPEIHLYFHFLLTGFSQTGKRACDLR